MLENLPGDLSTVAVLAKLLEPIPELGLHLDIGHANLASRGTPPRKSSPRSPLACAMFFCTTTGVDRRTCTCRSGQARWMLRAW